MKWGKRAFGAACVAIGVSGCAGLAAPPPPATYDLMGGLPRGGASKTRAALAVAEPLAAPPLAGDRIVIRTGPQEVAFLAGAQWVDQLPRLVQARLIEDFDRGGVGAARPGANVPFTLVTNLRRFEIDVGRGLALVEISAQLLDSAGNERAARVFVGEAPAPSTEGAEAPHALEQALDSAAREMAGWLRRRL